MSLSLILIACTIIGFVFRCKNSIYSFFMHRHRISKVPSLKRIAYPLIGHSYLMSGSTEKTFYNLNDIFRKFKEKTNEKVATVWLGPVPMVFMLDTYGAEAILRSAHHLRKAFTYRCLHPWLGTGLLTSHGEKWKQRRRLITPSFHFSILQDFLDVMNEQSQALVKNLKRDICSTAEEKHDFCQAIGLCTLDIICETAMGQTVNAQENQDSDYIKALNK